MTFSHEIRICNIYKITVHKRLIAVCLLVIIQQIDRYVYLNVYILQKRIQYVARARY